MKTMSRWIKIKPVMLALAIAAVVGISLSFLERMLPANYAAAVSSVFRLSLIVDELLVIGLLIIFVLLVGKWAVTGALEHFRHFNSQLPTAARPVQR